MKPQIIIEDMSAYQGRHNLNPFKVQEIQDAKAYENCSTICIVPTRGVIPAKVVQNWFSLMSPMNQPFLRMMMIGMEVGEAYNKAIEYILSNPQLSTWKYILTLEEDNMPPPDGLTKLIENMDKYDVIGGLYWTKGEAGQPMCYGDPKVFPKNFIPRIPTPDTLVPCNGLGMGFTLFKLDMFKDTKLRKPWFQTLQKWSPTEGARSYTQDLYFFEDAGKYYRFACDTRVKVGHYDLQNDIIW
jgi:hypothetical protein